MVTRAWGGGAGQRASASFDWARTFMPAPAAAPADVNGMADACIAPGTTVVAVTRTVARTAAASYSVIFNGLSQNFPYTTTIVEVASGGATTVYGGYVPLAWARPMPPRPWQLGALYLARNLVAGSPLVAPSGSSLRTWPDVSGHGHTLMSNIAPYIASSQYQMAAVIFTRGAGTNMQTGADSIDLGGSTEFTAYVSSVLTSSSPSFIAGRGIGRDVTSFGYGMMEYADYNNPWPGSRGWRVTDNAGNMASLGQPNWAYWSYIWAGSYVWQMLNSAAQSTPLSLFPYAAKYITTHRPQEIGDTPYDTQSFGGFALGSMVNANQSTFSNPVAVSWAGGVATPAPSAAHNFHIGAPMSTVADPFRSMDGQIMSIATYREGHANADWKAVQTYFDWHDFRRCYSIVTPNVAYNGNCPAGYRDYYCGQWCTSGYAMTAGTQVRTRDGGERNSGGRSVAD